MEHIPDVSRCVVEPGDVAVETDGHGRMTLRRRRFVGLSGRIVGWFGASRDFTIHLDALGTAAWQLMDGTRTVGEVRIALLAAFPDQPDVTTRLGKFVGTLVSHKMARLR